MKAEDFDGFDALMQGLAENYGQSLTPQGIALRFEMLAGYEIGGVKKAAFAILANRKYTTMPTVADFLEHLGGGSAEDRGQVEAGKVLEAIRRIGPYVGVVFDDPVTQAVIAEAYGGWPALAEHVGKEESEHWFRKNFAATYAAYRRQGRARYGHMAGRIEIDNSAKGYLECIRPPQPVGNSEMAWNVLQAGGQGAPTESIDKRTGTALRTRT
jgi:hypothetical protein